MKYWLIEILGYLAMLGINFWLIRTHRRTISQRYHRLFNQRWDYVVMIVFYGVQVYVYARWFPVIGLGEIAALCIRNIIAGHWFWHED